ncbi:FAD binding domain-containing protein [Panus rudis PR-1116 ss-1]|nr:FAD binding domain-containing protein [Panus rudis PR-1116 ss-1]
MTDFETFKQQFKGDLVLPTDPGYDEAIDRWAHNAIKQAKIVAFVKDAADVAAAINYAKANKLPLAIRGGGHSASGSSSVEDGLVIDLSRYINGATVDLEKKLIYVGGGAVWKTVDHAAAQHGLATVGGTVNHVNLSANICSLITGGGYGWLSSKHGLVIDNLVTVVTADGSILTANDSQNTDLFWAIRGGGSNFGVVTEFVLKAHPQRRTVFAGALVFTPDKLEEVADAADKWWETATEDESIMTIFTSNFPPVKKPAIIVPLFYNGSEEEGRAKFRVFYDIGPVVALANEVPYEEVNGMQNPLADPGFNYYMKGGLLSEIPSKDLRRTTFNEIMKLAKEDLTVTMIFERQPHQKINSVPADVTPFRRNLTGNALILIRWKDDSPEKSKAAQAAARHLATLLPKGQGYGNYDDSVAEKKEGIAPPNAAEALYGDAYPRLQAIKKKYDPEMIFNKWFLIVPA